ncbi:MULTISPECIES: ATP-binding protein [Streptomyces]|uniref:ATP/GTP-binding protein n=1 Tax=Streptomyces dengpaensis TaxID=2049881 RepID=A0ABN5IF50_9ACTN|nr:MULTISPECIES: ATP-binding protein [Streptomyces]AVH61835.1 ATP/GTP-binding protein [Streptomyces dengpaensis]PIB04545.1 ATP/GTP-binding protein [Streptomyces sp. HG99]
MTAPAPLYPDLPKNALVVLIGASGSGKSTLAATWPPHQVVSLDSLRGVMSDDCGDQSATADAVDAMLLIVNRRMARGLNTVVDATSVLAKDRALLVDAAKQHNMPVIAVLVSTPLPVCIERQQPRPANRAVPDSVVTDQHRAMVAAHPNLRSEGFNEVFFSDTLYRLEPLLEQISNIRIRELGQGGDDGLGDLIVPRRFFGPELMPLWRWKDGSRLAGDDRVAEIRIGQQYLNLALRTDIDGEGSIGFEVLLPCPFDDECEGEAWAPAYTVTDLWGALTGDRDQDPDIVCTVHGGFDDVDQEADDHADNSGQEDDPEGHADLEAQAMEAVHG